MTCACSIRVRGIVQGVGFRPFVFRLARENELAGWVLNAGEGVEIRVEGAPERVRNFLGGLRSQAPPAAVIAGVDVEPASVMQLTAFSIRESARQPRPTAGMSPDLPACERCVRELLDSGDPRALYPYITCTDCGPRYSIVRGLPYDRQATTMADWVMDDRCAAEYHDPASRRYHAQPIACPSCGPHLELRADGYAIRGDAEVIREAATRLVGGEILAVKGLGGYHLVCDARNASAVARLRERKYRKEKPFAVMARDVDTVHAIASVSAASETLLTSTARPIVILPASVELLGVAPGSDTVGVMLPYTPVHHLLFAAAAPSVLVVTSANRSSEPIAYRDDDALGRLAGVADAFLIGQRQIARRVEDSVVREGCRGPVILRRSRGYAPCAVTTLPTQRPILAVGGDLKAAITLVVGGQTFVSQHLGDLVHYDAMCAFEETVEDLLRMYEVRRDELLVVCDRHPEYLSTMYAERLDVTELVTVQHHRAHIASVMAEGCAWEKRVVGVAWDGTGFGDDRTIWGGEVFVGSVAQGFDRVGHLRPAPLVGGDAAARHPVQAAVGFLADIEGLPSFEAKPFTFPPRYRRATQVLRAGTRVLPTTSVGRLFDTAAALLGFTGEVSFEGQAAIWLEQLARRGASGTAYEFPLAGCELDFRPLLRSVVQDRLRGRDVQDVARAFHGGLAHGLVASITATCEEHGVDTVVASGGVFQNELLLAQLSALLDERRLALWTNHAVPPNDGGLSLGQAALASFGQSVPADARTGVAHDAAPRASRSAASNDGALIPFRGPAAGKRPATTTTHRTRDEV